MVVVQGIYQFCIKYQQLCFPLFWNDLGKQAAIPIQTENQKYTSLCQMSNRPLLLIEIQNRKMQKLEILLPCRAEYSITVPIFQSLGVLIFWEHESRITS